MLQFDRILQTGLILVLLGSGDIDQFTVDVAALGFYQVGVVIVFIGEYDAVWPFYLCQYRQRFCLVDIGKRPLLVGEAEDSPRITSFMIVKASASLERWMR